MLKHTLEKIEIKQGSGLFYNKLTIYFDDKFDVFNNQSFKDDKNVQAFFETEIKPILDRYSKLLPHKNENFPKGYGGTICFDINCIPQVVNVDTANSARLLLSVALQSVIYSSQIVLGREVPKGKKRAWMIPGEPTPRIQVDAEKCSDKTLEVLKRGACFGCSGVGLIVPKNLEEEFNSTPCSLG